jgi:cytoskeletal protein CcmA (bactofilin family)
MDNQKIETILGEGTTLKGDIVSSGIIRLDGKFTGNVVGSNVIIGKAAIIEADIKCAELTIYGKVRGNVIAERNIEIQPGGELVGDIKASSSNIMKGAHFSGSCELRSDED